MQSGPAKPTILLVEDSEDDAFFFKRVLAKLGFIGTCAHVEDGHEAIGYLQRARADGCLPQLTFLDLKMPKINGFEFLMWLNHAGFDPALPVVILSGSDHAADIQLSRELGARDYLVKPVTTNSLTAILSAFSLACALKVAA